jgi:hypothetical protein
MLTWKGRFTEMRKSKGKVFFIDGDELLAAPDEGGNTTRRKRTT